MDKILNLFEKIAIKLNEHDQFGVTNYIMGRDIGGLVNNEDMNKEYKAAIRWKGQIPAVVGAIGSLGLLGLGLRARKGARFHELLAQRVPRDMFKDTAAYAERLSRISDGLQSASAIGAFLGSSAYLKAHRDYLKSKGVTKTKYLSLAKEVTPELMTNYKNRFN